MEKKIESYLSFVSKQPRGTIYKASEKKTKTEKLQELKEKFISCTLCPLAKEGRKNIVFGHGNPNTKLMLVGEGPGRDEDTQGIPFVGRAGQLLTKIIAAMGLDRKDLYISNVVKCRPPNNRAPLPNESKTCKNNILFNEINIIKPKVICTLGSVATQELLEKPISISKIRGQFIKYNESLLMPTFHPAYLLRNPSQKKAVWEDMKKIMKKLEDESI